MIVSVLCEVHAMQFYLLIFFANSLKKLDDDDPSLLIKTLEKI